MRSKKIQNRDKRSDRQTDERPKRHEKHGRTFEDQKDYGIKIILRVELNLRVADRFDAAFVGRNYSDRALAVGKIDATAKPALKERVETPALRQ